MLTRSIFALLIAAYSVSTPAQADQSYNRRFAGEDGEGPGKFDRGSWLLDCNTDKITDKTRCDILSQITDDGEFADFQIMVEKTGIYARVSRQRFYPGSTQYLRIDDAPAVELGAEGWFDLTAKNSALLNRLLSGHMLRTRWYKFPNKDRSIDKESPLAGLRVVVKAAQDYLAGKNSTGR